MKNKVFIIISLLFIFSGKVFALTATPSATVTPTVVDDQTVKENLQTRVKEIIQEKLSSSEAQIKEKVNQLSLVGYAGKVTTVTSNSLTLNSNKEIFQVAISDNTEILNAGQKVKLASVAIGDKIIVIGTMNAKKDLITAKRLNVVKASTAAPAEIYQGSITSVASKTRSLSLKTNKETINLLLAKKANLKIEDLQEGQKLLVIVYPQNSDKVVFKAKIL